MVKNYSGLNLRGKSFQGQDLTNANFNGSDIRGANFTKAILKGANFSETTSGLQLLPIVCTIALSLLIIALGSIITGIGAIVLVELWDLEKDLKIKITTYIVILISLLAFAIITVAKNFLHGLFVAILVLTPSLFLSFIVSKANTTIIGQFLFGIAILCLIGIGWIIIALANIMMINIISYLPIVIFIGLIINLISAVSLLIKVPNITKPTLIGLTIVIVSILGNNIGWQASKGSEKFSWIKKVAISINSIYGTTFFSADLTDADFTGATLKNTDFRAANLTRTRFYEVKKLDFARPGNTILSNPDILNLLITLNGRNKSYIGANLRGANLIGADLKEANFKNADIIEATFQGANLEGANLTLTQAVGTNFTKAHITGACVEAWNIESTTKLDNVDCRFVYLLEYPKPRTDDRERRPSSGEFQPGEFTKLFEEVLNTVDLIFRNGIDWKAFITAFKKVQVENQDTELVIQSIENKGDGVVVVKVAVPENANKEKIHSDFTENYQLALAAVEEKYKAVLQAKDEEINFHRQQSGKIPEMILSLANKPINVQIDNKVENKNMTNSNDSSRKVEIGSIGRDFNASGQALNLGEISGTVTNTINELATAPEPDKPGIKELLTQLKTAIETDTDLTAKDKEKALKQVKSLAEAAQNPQEKQDLADTAITMLKGTIAHLPTAAKLVEECAKLLPLIAGFLGLG
ncbi:pentapeptide repeat-containing protein [Dolichospermum circinale]|uniref:pentapeptide repeat-containing protein n=1 Tax=Dolichospermum circinale TaxID=109265 RepID=UPI00232E4B55|nr:pentapeptide repeat-containing protein [Dolichospermum circinale]MDB9465248.1 pentapeptide repeat-containing protein [Dolichospermum circinale CS-539/09]MDB9471387.1 pentapeptide repeat-containing protein [Dolichospermum circinale CS-539]